ncbi:MAG: hypothetical protein HQK92_13035 [Nitrospirae bacterium]|nr:hypothetical protein [Nitrospirota bacterium]
MSESINILNKHIKSLQLGNVTSYKNLTLYPLSSSINNNNDYLTLEDAINSGKFLVTEINDSGSVPELKVLNLLNENVLIIDGEELVGAKQNRIVNASLIISKNSEQIIPVSCVEENRWEYKSKTFSASENYLYSSLRKKKSCSILNNLRNNASYTSNQREIWADIEKKSNSQTKRKISKSMEAIYAAQKQELNNYEKAFNFEEGDYVGFIALVDGKIAGCDIFSSKTVFSKVFKKLLRSYILDCINTDGVEADFIKYDMDNIRKFIQKINKLKKEEYDSKGLGKDIRFINKNVSGYALVNDNEAVHVAVFQHN